MVTNISTRKNGDIYIFSLSVDTACIILSNKTDASTKVTELNDDESHNVRGAQAANRNSRDISGSYHLYSTVPSPNEAYGIHARDRCSIILSPNEAYGIHTRDRCSIILSPNEAYGIHTRDQCSIVPLQIKPMECKHAKRLSNSTSESEDYI